jgi:probable HAF family extracellular repeat protein
VLTAALVAALLACGSEETPTGPADAASLVRKAAGTYRVVDLGTLGGFSRAIAINAAGQIVGVSATPTGNIHGFLWLNGVATPTSRATSPSFTLSSGTRAS